MFWIHPIWQFATLVLAAYVLRLGWVRFAFLHFDRKGRFLWKRHVALGKAAIFMWVYGVPMGGAASWVKWRTFGVTGYHFYISIAIVILVVFGYSSGWYMDTYKKKRKALPLLHGAANFFALVLSIISLVTGVVILNKYFFQF